MNAYKKSLLAVSEIKKRDSGLPLARTGKGGRDVLLLRPLYPSNPTSLYSCAPKLSKKVKSPCFDYLPLVSVRIVLRHCANSIPIAARPERRFSTTVF